MSFLKRHLEKILLALALLGLIGSAVYLSGQVDALNREIKQTPDQIRRKGRSVEPLDFRQYSNAVATLESPFLWTEVVQDPWDTAPPPPEITTNDFPRPGPDQEVWLARTWREPIELLFKSYTGEGQDFGINYRNITFFVTAVGGPISNRYHNTGYQITKFERKSEPVEQGPLREQDVSALTIQRGEQEPVELVLGRVTYGKEWVGQVGCAKYTRTLKLYQGKTFTCEGKTYIVIDMTSDSMIIKNEETEEETEIKVLVPSKE